MLTGSMKRAMDLVRMCAAAAALVGGAGLGWSGVAQAQTDALPVSWSSPDVQRIGEMLCGTWKTDAAVPIAGAEGDGDGSGEPVHVLLSIGAVGIEGMPNAMYAEMARDDNPHRPYRQAIYQLFEYRGKIRLRTYEFHNANVEKNAFIGAWAIPEIFPPMNKNQFIATLDVEGTPSGSGFTGRTPAPYPTAVGGAVEMTSEMELTATRLVTADRGYDATGAIVWGQEAGGRYVFSKVTPDTTLTRHEDGLVVLEYRSGTGRETQAGDTAAFHYSGWFTRNATLFDSSHTRGVPFSYTVPGQMIAGWIRGNDKARPGTLRRIYVPYALGYGEVGQPPRMPAKSNLVFEVECINVAPAPQAPAGTRAPATPDAASDTAGG